MTPDRPHEFPSLGDSHVLLTGATGFLGQATLEKLLSAHPGVRVSVLIRPRGGTSAQRRFDGLLRKPVFRTMRERIGEDELRRIAAERVNVIEGDLGEVTLPSDIDVVIHGASTVSFDPPIDEAFRTNVSGVVTLYEALHKAGADPHVVHVSTAYVAGVRKGVVPEARLDHGVDWRTELAEALAAHADVERDSRRPEVLRKSMARAQGEHRKAGPQSVVAAAEEARQAWVTDRLVDYGRARAQSLGWPDVYTFTKALGERAAEELWGERRLSIVRPAIVESSLRHPYPGWIDGYKMADPLIIAYGRGILPEFPGLPDSVVDIIPVDLVVNATIAVAATPPERGTPGYFHVGSGSRNPLSFRGLYENVRDYFRRHPMPAGERGHIRVPQWRFPGSRQVEMMLSSSERATSAAERALLRLPASAKTREWMTAVHRQQTNLDFLRRYSDLYQAYTKAEVIYDDSRTHALHRTVPADRVDEHGFDPSVIDWEHYLQEVHSPSVTELMRGFSKGRGGGRKSADPVLPERTDVAAVFDLEGTIIASNLIESYLWARLSSMPRSQWSGELADLARSLPRYLRAERRDRGDFVRAFLRRYQGADVAELHALVKDVLGEAVLQRVMPEAVRRIRAHRAAGHKTILITGTIDVFVEPLATLFDEVVASRMHERDGRLTGYLDAPPLVDEARAAWLRRHAADTGLDLSQSYAYADSYSDRPLLEAVGNANAVNPDPSLYRHAKRKHWRIHEWGAHTRGRGDVLIDTVGARSAR
ncbi:HAD-IB family hydrolase [Actinoallomurus rhizosphaericola]|uniref:HAD-IB family hydrolase n=1 Tax=Actinoallomurus rhizosphaericola TaxID=2952536 RepID=UPI002093FAB6|nr:HAD-IB family hydrolase [Actinoallomurus rhizosphaericola]MCO5998187.1 HAD-IB family hydrolase [Actinoallomurus rhizosphaericola]